MTVRRDSNEAWGTRIGLILAMAGNAVGLGNFLRFPVQAATNGGGSFMITYFIALLLLGLPLMWIEWGLGRNGGRYRKGHIPGMFAAIWKHPVAKYVGVVGMVIPLVVMIYYTYIESWTLAFMLFSLVGDYWGRATQPEMIEYLQSFQGVGDPAARVHAAWSPYLFFVVTLAVNIWIISKGISGGIEKLARVGMPVLFLSATVLAVVVFFLPPGPDGSTAWTGLDFIYSPDMSRLGEPSVWLASAGQIFFTLSVGMGSLQLGRGHRALCRGLRRADPARLAAQWLRRSRGLPGARRGPAFERGGDAMSVGAIASMTLSWTFVLGLTVWSFRRVSQKQRKLALFLALMVLPFVNGQPVLAASQQVAATAQMERRPGGEANLVLPDLAIVDVGGYDSRTLLMSGLLVSAIGIVFGLVILRQIKKMPVHQSMHAISELIYETCKTYLLTQGRFLAVLEIFIAIVIVLYFGVLSGMEPMRVGIILLFSVVGILGSYCVAWFGIRVNTYANSRTAFASLAGKAYPVYAIPLRAGMSIGMLLISVELLIMLFILLFVPREYAGPCFIGFAIGESLGAAALRIAGGIFTKIADIGSDLMKIEFNIKEDDARNPGVIADCTGDNAGDSVGPSADGFETYGVTGVALITFIMLAVPEATTQVQLLVWIFVMRIVMIIASGGSYLLNEAAVSARYGNAARMNFEAPLTSLVWITSIVSVLLTYAVSYALIAGLGDGTLWWKLGTIITCGTLAGAIIPEVVKVFTSVDSRHVNEVVASSREGGASLNILSGLVAGNFSAFWLGLVIVGLMSIAYLVSASSPAMQSLMLAPAVFAFGLVAFGFLGMGPVTIAVDSYGPVTDNAQSVFELSVIDSLPGIAGELEHDFGLDVRFDEAKALLEENDGAGNTFKATAKPVLIGTAVVGATTMIFSIIVALTHGLTENLERLSLLHAPFLLGLITGGSVIYWFTGASMQAVTTGAHRAVQFIKANIKLEGVAQASITDSKKVVEICTQYAQKGMFNIFLTVFFATLAFAFVEPYFFIGYLISIALFGLYQAVFMANAGGAWDNAKKIVETELGMKNTPLHAATVVGDTVGDPFKDTSSVALNPVIKFTTLFGLLAVELAVSFGHDAGTLVSQSLAALFFAVALTFVYRSFYGMRIGGRAETRD